MRVAIGTITVDDEQRRLIAHLFGHKRRRATRADVRAYTLTFGTPGDDDWVEFSRCDCNPYAVPSDEEDFEYNR